MKYLSGLSYDSSGGPLSLASKYNSWPTYTKSEETQPVKTKDMTTPDTSAVKSKKKKRKSRRNISAEIAVQNESATQAQTAAAFTANSTFVLCCEKAGVPPTKRQASKFRKGTGVAYQQIRLL